MSNVPNCSKKQAKLNHSKLYWNLKKSKKGTTITKHHKGKHSGVLPKMSIEILTEKGSIHHKQYNPSYNHPHHHHHYHHHHHDHSSHVLPYTRPYNPSTTSKDGQTHIIFSSSQDAIDTMSSLRRICILTN